MMVTSPIRVEEIHVAVSVLARVTEGLGDADQLELGVLDLDLAR